MDRYTQAFLQNWQAFVIPAAVFAAVFLGGVILRRYLFRTLRRWAEATPNGADNLIVEILHGPFLLWCAIGALHVAAQVSALPDRVTRLSSKALLVLWIISLTLVAVQVSTAALRRFSHRGNGALPMTSLSLNVVRIIVVMLGATILLHEFGISVTPILTALGVGGIAVALALQDTLSNLFAGFYISVAGQLRVGDYVRLDSGQEGYVHDISWRSTSLRALSNNLIIIPNAKLAQTIVTNFFLPDRPLSVSITVNVDPSSDPDQVERLLTEIGVEGAGQIEGLLASPAPSARFNPGFGDRMLGFTLGFHVEKFVDQYFVQHELRKRILKRFRQEGIVMFPDRTVYVRESKEDV